MRTVRSPRFQRGQRTQELVSAPVDQEVSVRKCHAAQLGQHRVKTAGILRGKKQRTCVGPARIVASDQGKTPFSGGKGRCEQERRD